MVNDLKWTGNNTLEDKHRIGSRDASVDWGLGKFNHLRDPSAIRSRLLLSVCAIPYVMNLG